MNEQEERELAARIRIAENEVEDAFEYMCMRGFDKPGQDRRGDGGFEKFITDIKKTVRDQLFCLAVEPILDAQRATYKGTVTKVRKLRKLLEEFTEEERQELNPFNKAQLPVEYLHFTCGHYLGRKQPDDLEWLFIDRLATAYWFFTGEQVSFHRGRSCQFIQTAYRIIGVDLSADAVRDRVRKHVKHTVVANEKIKIKSYDDLKKDQ